MLQETQVRGGGVKNNPIHRVGVDFFWNNPILLRDTSKMPRSVVAHTATLLTIYHRIDSEYCSQSDNSIHDRTLVDLH